MIVFAATAHAAYYKALYCAAADGSGNPTLGARPGFFDFTDDCGTAYGDPAGTGGFLRLEENTTGAAGNTDEASYSWWAPSGTSIAAVSAYTRVPDYFNLGWRERFWAEGFDGSENNILVQGSGVPNEGIYAPATTNFGYHAWPFGSYGDYKRLVFAMTCYRPAGCSREGWNAADTNSIAITLNDNEAPRVNWEGDSQVLAGQWVRGYNPISWRESDVGSGLRFSRLKVDDAVLSDGTIDYQANGGCRTGRSDANGEFARDFTPCTAGPYLRYYGLEAKGFADGQHEISICVQDYAQYQHIGGSASESCDSRTIRTDNSAPGEPASLEVTSANPARYLSHFGAKWSLPPNTGSPIVKVHYYVTDDRDGAVVVPEKVVSATNPTSLSSIEGAVTAGAYTLHVALEDQVGFISPFATAPVPHDTTPPAAPQALYVVGTTAHRVSKFDVRWDNASDAGSSIDTARYQVIDSSGAVVVPAQAVSGDNIEAIHDISTPPRTGDLSVRVWLTDAEGNAGAAATVAIPRDATPPAPPQDLSVAAPSSSRASQSFDLRWRNIVDDGSPIDAAHYRIVNDSGDVVVPTKTVTGDNIERVADLDTPYTRGGYTLVLWLTDSEGNTGAPVKAPLVYNCVRADDAGGFTLTADVGKQQTNIALLHQGQGTTLNGNLSGLHTSAPICVFSQVITDDEREFLGIALTNPNGDYRFSIPAGPSRELTAVYRLGQRELSAQASVRTKVRPTFRLVRKVVRNMGFAIFETAIPGPRQKNVVILLQVKSGKGWRVFRSCHTRASGRCLLRYRFTQTPSPTVYIMRAQVRAQSGYPYQQGSSKARRLRVVPSTSRARKAR